METIRVGFSGLNGRTGRAAREQEANVTGVEIVAGMRNRQYPMDDVQLYGSTYGGVHWLLYDTGIFGVDGLVNQIRQDRVDVLVDFSHAKVFDLVLELAIRTNVPLISGTSGLSDRQEAMLYNAANLIPVFRGGNFRFKVKEFIDKAVARAQTDDDLILRERHWLGQPLPSEAAKRLRRAVREATGKYVAFSTCKPYPSESLINEWTFESSEGAAITCRTVGFDELAHDVLEIAKVMAKKPVRKGEPYDLDDIWDDLPH